LKTYPICYLCRRRPGNTKDHAPAKNLWQRPLPPGENLPPRLPCCERCNNRFSPLDEYFRFAVSLCINRSSSGDRAWERVKRGTLIERRIARMIDTATASIRATGRAIEAGLIPAIAINVEARPIRAVLIKYVKAFLYQRDPAIDSRALSFKITAMDQFAFSRLEPTLANFPHFQICGDAFNCWFGLTAGTVPNGVWYMRFYHAAAFLVAHFERGKEPLFNTAEDFASSEGEDRTPGTG
jgi:hypothetical protein